MLTRSQLLVVLTTVLSVLRPATSTSSSVEQAVERELGERTAGGIHLPLYRSVKRTSDLQRRAGQTGQIGLGDYYDVTYNVLIKVGNNLMPVVLDSGSSDLWVISTACTTKECTTNVPLYSSSSFTPAGIPVTLLYGDSFTGTSAEGQIGTDSISFAGLNLGVQYFASITSTNTSVLETGSAGIFGLGFPINSFVWSDIFKAKYVNAGTKKRDPEPSYDFKRTRFPSISSLYPQLESRQATSNNQWTDVIISTYATLGPFLPRLIQTASLASPMYSVTLQRDAFAIGGNVGMLSIGELPSGVSHDSLTWVPLRTYSPADGGLYGPVENPNMEYPLTWEVSVDAVFLDGQQLPKSNLSLSISTSALIDTGNSLIRGPQDVVDYINRVLTGGTGSKTFSCATPHVLGFQIGGKVFNVDPRDFVSQAYSDNVQDCVANLAATDTPVAGHGYLYSWSFGDPMLKSVLAAFYYGNISFPTVDPPKMGFLSTVPADASAQYIAAVQANHGSNFPFTTEAPPNGLPTGLASTNADGVQTLATNTAAADVPGGQTTGSPGGGGVGGSGRNAAVGSRRPPVGMTSLCWLAVVVIGMMVSR